MTISSQVINLSAPPRVELPTEKCRCCREHRKERAGLGTWFSREFVDIIISGSNCTCFKQYHTRNNTLTLGSLITLRKNKTCVATTYFCMLHHVGTKEGAGREAFGANNTPITLHTMLTGLVLSVALPALIRCATCFAHVLRVSI